MKDELKEKFLLELASLFSRYGIEIVCDTKYIETMDDAFAIPGELKLKCDDFEVTEEELTGCQL